MHLVKLKGRAETQGGFTLIELLVVIGILAILLAITLIALNPNQHFQGARNAQRSSNVSEILNAIYEYQAQNNGNLPASVNIAIPSYTAIAGGTGHPTDIDLCDLVPAYIADLPTDPDTTASNVAGGNTPCDPSTTSYDTGYKIVKTNGRFTVTAPATEGGGPDITVTR
jgi:prepilin-type N-terminal cleavage/methylation domain-containing protein